MDENENEKSSSSGDEVEGEGVREMIQLWHLWGSGECTKRGDKVDNVSQDRSPQVKVDAT